MSASRELADLVSESPSTDLNLDNNTLFVDVSENRVGIGTTTPGFTLDVQGTLTVGVDDTGHDVKFFGATSGKYMLWDESADSLIVSGTLTASSGTFSGDVSFGDNNKAQFGASNDLQIYHNGSYSAIVDDGTGNLVVAANDLQMTNADVSENYIRAYNNDRVELYYDNGEKLRTTSTGINVSGNVVIADGGNIGSASDTDAITIDSSGNVGIGVTPTNRLAVKSTSSSLVASKVYHGTTFQIEDATHNAAQVVAYSEIDKAVQFAVERSKSSGSYNDMWVMGMTENSKDWRLAKDTLGTALTVDTSGNVGIGTDAPRAKAEVYDSSVSGTFSATDLSTWRVLQIRNNIEGGAGTAAGIALGGDGTGDTETAGIVGISDNTTGGVCQLAFITATGNASSERMRIDSSGRIITLTNPLIIGSTSVNSSYASGGSAISNALLLERSTSPPNDIVVQNASNNTQAYLYCEQDGGVAKVFVMDSNGTKTQISTHTNDDEKDYEIFDSSIINGKKRYRRINVIKLTRALEKLTGEKFLREWYD